MRRRTAGLLVVAAVAWMASLQSVPAQQTVAVFDFQMKSGAPAWQWMEKALADRTLTELLRCPSVNLVARDRIQDMARQMHWVPEMATDPGQLEMMDKALRINFIVSGSYEVRDDTTRVSVMTVDFVQRKLVMARVVEGANSNAVDLVDAAAAEVVAWFRKAPTNAVVREMSPWTRSIPGAQAVYDGLRDLDNGAPAKALVCFQTAAHADTNYTDALYWMGKAYSILGRSEHARLALDAYLNHPQKRPRVMNALWEYAHLYERDPSVRKEQLLDFYKRLNDPSIRQKLRVREQECGAVTSVFDWKSPEWTQARLYFLQGQDGRYSDVVDTMLRSNTSAFYGEGNAILWDAVFNNYRKTMSLPPFAFLKRDGTSEICGYVVLLHNGNGPLTRVEGVRGGRKGYPSEGDQLVCLLAPQGTAIRRCRIKVDLVVVPREGHDMFPREEEATRMKFPIPIQDGGGVSDVRCLPADVAREEGFAVDNPPIGGLMFFSVEMVWQLKREFVGNSEKIPTRRPPFHISDISVSAEIESLPSNGCLQVDGTPTPYFRVDVDGRFGRKGAGIVGPLAPGAHVLRFSPSAPGIPCLPWETNVTVVAGSPLQVEARMKFDPANTWGRWLSPVLVGKDYPSYALTRRYSERDTYFAADTTIQADDGGIRLVWSWDDDIWLAASQDGVTFSAPRRLDSPVSSSRCETTPRLIHDQSGRYVLMFLIDWKVCVSWSRDLVHWSNPVPMQEKAVAGFDFIQRNDGTYLAAVMVWQGFQQRFLFLASRDLHTWKDPGKVNIEGDMQQGDTFAILQDPSDPEVCILFIGHNGTISTVRSCDTVKWSQRQEILRFPEAGRLDISRTEFTAFHGRGDQPCVVASVRTTEDYNAQPAPSYSGPATYMCWQAGTGPWQTEGDTGLGIASANYHSRWGHMVAWETTRRAVHLQGPKAGPFFMRRMDFPESQGQVPDILRPRPSRAEIRTH